MSHTEDFEKKMGDERKLMKLRLKEYLFKLAEHSEQPAQDLEALLMETINEMYWEAKEALAERKSALRLVERPQSTQ